VLVPVEVAMWGGTACSLFSAASAAVLAWTTSPELVAMFYALASAGTYTGTAAFLYAALHRISPWDAGIRGLRSRVWAVLVLPALQVVYQTYMGFRTADMFLTPASTTTSAAAWRYAAEVYAGKLLFFAANAGFGVLLWIAQARVAAALRRGVAPYLLAARRVLDRGDSDAASATSPPPAYPPPRQLPMVVGAAAVEFVPAAGSLGRRAAATAGSDVGTSVPSDAVVARVVGADTLRAWSQQASVANGVGGRGGGIGGAAMPPSSALLDDGAWAGADERGEYSEAGTGLRLIGGGVGVGGLHAGHQASFSLSIDGGGELSASAQQLDRDMQTGTFRAMRVLLRVFLGVTVAVAGMSTAAEVVAVVFRDDQSTAFAASAVSYWGVQLTDATNRLHLLGCPSCAAGIRKNRVVVQLALFLSYLLTVKRAAKQRSADNAARWGDQQATLADHAAEDWKPGASSPWTFSL
ncbi:hypothetical protein HK405_003704, partial [Cladochytrium tenue]